MPLPFFLIAGALATAAVGVKKGIDAKDDYDSAKYLNEQANDIVEDTNDKIKKARQSTQDILENLGKLKLEILSGSVYDFVQNFEKIKKMNIIGIENTDELEFFTGKDNNLAQLKSISYEAKDMVQGGIAAIGGGTLVALGTYHVVMGGLGGALVTATTGTALSSLSGAAATNATLAWLGGGALSAGGFGMAGGAMVLGGLVAGPALAIGGIIASKKAEEAYWDARENKSEAEAYQEQGKNIVSELKAIVKISKQYKGILEDLNSIFIPQVNNLKNFVNEYQYRRERLEWKNIPVSYKKSIAACAATAKVIKNLLSVSILDEKGKIENSVKEQINKGEKFLMLSE